MWFTQRGINFLAMGMLMASLHFANSYVGQSLLSDMEGKWEGTMISSAFHEEAITVKVTMEIEAISDHEWKWLTIYEENQEKKWPKVVKDYRMVWVDSTKTPIHLVEDDGFTIFFSPFENQLIGTFLVENEEGTDVFQSTYTLYHEQELWFTLTGFSLPMQKMVMGEMEPHFFQKTILRKKKN